MTRAGSIGCAALALAAVAVPAVAQPSADPTIAEQRRRLVQAKAAAALATGRAEATRRAADAERDAAARARDQRAAVAAEVAAARADLAAARARVALVARLLAGQRARLAAGEAPVARLLGALASLARRPALAGVAQPGSVDDLVHLRAVLGSAVPAIRARTAGVRAQLAATRRLEDGAALAMAALARSRVALDRRRAALAALETLHGGRADALGRVAMAQDDRAIALGEQARDLVDTIARTGDRRSVLARLEVLPGPDAPAPALAPADAATAAEPAPAYRLPAAGRLVTGFGELSPAGVRARGLTLAVAPGAAVTAPAGGRIAYAGRFRGYGGIVIVDHGAGWSTLLVGLDAIRAPTGARVAAGTVLGTVAAGRDPRVTVELRRRGRPVDPAGLL